VRIEPGKPLPRLHLQAQAREVQTGYERIAGPFLNLLRSATGAFSYPGTGWIAIPFYHWVLDDEREAFRRQLQYLRRCGDFVSLDDTVAMLRRPSSIKGRYFCVTFDDGFKNCYTNAVPVLKELGIPAAFFLSTQYIGLDLERDRQQLSCFYKDAYLRYRYYFEFLSWEECRQMAAAGFTIGSHTHTHARLFRLRPPEVEQELRISKEVIERQLGQPCVHFCCPWGRANRDFNPLVHPRLAEEAGYASFLTTNFGVNRAGDSAFALRRIGITPEEGPLRLRYALFPSGINSLRASWAWRGRRTVTQKNTIRFPSGTDGDPVELCPYPFPY
jgi:peptidoglycan/xylan/chitin deacetylase (PgdA/CDA1 family)